MDWVRLHKAREQIRRKQTWRNRFIFLWYIQSLIRWVLRTPRSGFQLRYLWINFPEGPTRVLQPAGWISWLAKRSEYKVLALVSDFLAHLSKLNSNEWRVREGRFSEHPRSDLMAISQWDRIVPMTSWLMFPWVEISLQSIGGLWRLENWF